MGELLLCRRPIAATPYYIDEMSLNIYSLEELSYYISHNVYLINHDFMSVDLCNFIGRDLGMKELQNELLVHIEKNGTLADFIKMVLDASGYLTTSEIKDTVSIISNFENKSEAECRKWRADRLLEKMRYIDAIYEYEVILEEENISGMNAALLGDVWHNLGTCYARLFFFNQAADCYRKAYENNHKVISLKAYLCCYKCNHNDAAYNEAVNRFFVSSDSERQIEKLIEEIEKSEEIVSFDEKIDEIRQLSFDDMREELKETVIEWKNNYNNICRI